MVPASFRKRLGLREGVRFRCLVKDGSLVLTPEGTRASRNRIVIDRATGLAITHGPADAPKVSSEQIKALLADFP